MTRTVLAWLVSAGLLGCTYTTKIHMEKIEENGGAAGEASTTTEEGTPGGSSTAAGGSHGDADSR